MQVLAVEMSLIAMNPSRLDVHIQFDSYPHSHQINGSVRASVGVDTFGLGARVHEESDDETVQTYIQLVDAK